MKCLYCQKELNNPKAKFCCEAHRKRFTRTNQPGQNDPDNQEPGQELPEVGVADSDNNRDKRQTPVKKVSNNPDNLSNNPDNNRDTEADKYATQKYLNEGYFGGRAKGGSIRYFDYKGAKEEYRRLHGG